MRLFRRYSPPCQPVACWLACSQPTPGRCPHRYMAGQRRFPRTNRVSCRRMFETLWPAWEDCEGQRDRRLLCPMEQRRHYLAAAFCLEAFGSIMSHLSSPLADHAVVAPCALTPHLPSRAFSFFAVCPSACGHPFVRERANARLLVIPLLSCPFSPFFAPSPPKDPENLAVLTASPAHPPSLTRMASSWVAAEPTRDAKSLLPTHSETQCRWVGGRPGRGHPPCGSFACGLRLRISRPRGCHSCTTCVPRGVSIALWGCVLACRQRPAHGSGACVGH